MSELPQLPSGWTWATLEELSLSVRNGVFVSRPSPTPPGVRILRISAVRPNRLDSEDVRYAHPEPPKVEEFVLREGDLLFTRYSGNPSYVGACAAVGPIAERTLHPDKLIRVVVNRDVVDPRFVQYAINGGYSRLAIESRLKTTAGQVGIAGGQLRTVPVPVAPRAEQERIVEAVEEHLSRLDAADTQLRSASQRSVALERSVLARAQADGDEGSLDELLVGIETGKSFKTPGRQARVDEWGVIKVSAMTWGAFDETENKAVPTDQVVDPRHEIRPGDLLLSRANTSEYVGATVLVRTTRPRLVLSDKSMRLVTTERVDRRWLRFALGSPQIRSQMSQLASGTSDSMRNISQAKVRSLRLRVPDLERQAQQANEIEECLEKRNRLARDLRVALTGVQALRVSVIAAAFSGQLVPQNPDDEPASVLLERIRAERQTTSAPKRRTRS